MDINQLTLLELDLLKSSLKRIIFEQPQLENIPVLLKQVKKHLKSDNRYIKGKELYKIAKGNGLEDGYAEATDYYFAVLETEGEKEVELILCLKYNWWMNGESYNPAKDTYWSRNFSDYDMPEGDENNDDWFEPGHYKADAQTVRAWFTKAGMEEKSEMLDFYYKYTDAVESYRKRKYK